MKLKMTPRVWVGIKAFVLLGGVLVVALLTPHLVRGHLPELRKAGMPYSNIVKFLSINGVEVTTAGLSDYVRRHALEEQGPIVSPPTPAKSAKPRQEAQGKSLVETKPSVPMAPDVFNLSKKPEVDMSFDK